MLFSKSSSTSIPLLKDLEIDARECEWGTCGEEIAETLLTFDRIQLTPAVQSDSLSEGEGIYVEMQFLKKIRA